MIKHEVEVVTVHKSLLQVDNKGSLGQKLQEILLAHDCLSLFHADQVTLEQLLDGHEFVLIFLKR